MILYRMLVTFLLANSILALAQSPKSKNYSRLLPVPIVRQATPYSCGNASLLAVLYYWNAMTEGELALHAPLDTVPEFGTHPQSMLRYAKSLGLQATLKTQVSLDEVEDAIDRKEPVIVDYQAWGSEIEKIDYSSVWDSGHYSVVIGYDKTWLYFMDPVLGSSYGKLDKQDFLKRWHDYETRNGKTEYFIQSAIFLVGKNPISRFPNGIAKID